VAEVRQEEGVVRKGERTAGRRGNRVRRCSVKLC
jgi:hypothetical protein